MPPRKRTLEELDAENEFIVHPGNNKPPDQMIWGIVGIPARRFIQMIIENKDGEFDHLYKKEEMKNGKTAGV